MSKRKLLILFFLLTANLISAAWYDPRTWFSSEENSGQTSPISLNIDSQTPPLPQENFSDEKTNNQAQPPSEETGSQEDPKPPIETSPCAAPKKISSETTAPPRSVSLDPAIPHSPIIFVKTLVPEKTVPVFSNPQNPSSHAERLFKREWATSENILQAIYAASSCTFSRLLFFRSFHPIFSRESFFGAVVASSQLKQSAQRKLFSAGKIAAVFGWERGQWASSFGVFGAYQHAGITASKWKVKSHDLYLGIFGSFFEDLPTYFTYSLIGCSSLAYLSYRKGLAASKATLAFLTATASLAFILDLSAAGLPWLYFFSRGDLFFSRGFSLRKWRLYGDKSTRECQLISSVLPSGECGICFARSFFKSEDFFTPYLSVSYVRQPNPLKHSVCPEIGCTVGNRYGASLNFTLRGEVGVNYRGGFFSLCSGF
ncbi:MAG: hypothetical protein AAF443_00245 [Chlamydiota bacterium]